MMPNGKARVVLADGTLWQWDESETTEVQVRWYVRIREAYDGAWGVDSGSAMWTLANVPDNVFGRAIYGHDKAQATQNAEAEAVALTRANAEANAYDLEERARTFQAWAQRATLAEVIGHLVSVDEDR
jgi:hypothetical protein